MYQNKEPGSQFDVVDLDPYGSAAPFLDAAVQAVADGGLLCVTCTDMTVLSGNYPETCFAKYGTFPVKTRYHTESAVRSLLNAIETSANRYKKYIEPWASLAIDFYCRVFVRVHISPAEVVFLCSVCAPQVVCITDVRFAMDAQVKMSCTKRGTVHQSMQCGSFFLQPLAELRSNGTFASSIAEAPSVCPETGGRIKLGGPYYLAPMHNKEVVNAILANLQRRMDSKNPDIMLANEVLTGPLSVEQAEALPVPTLPRLHGLLTAVSEELNDAPFFYEIGDLCSIVHSSTIPIQTFHSALINGGYRVSCTHKEPTAIKTNAPDSVVWDIVRCWCKINPPLGSGKRKKETAAAIAILAKEPKFIADFTIAEVLIDRAKALRHPPNPEDCWGPKKRAGRGPSGEPEPVEKKPRRPPPSEEEKAERAKVWKAKKAAIDNSA